MYNYFLFVSDFLVSDFCVIFFFYIAVLPYLSLFLIHCIISDVQNVQVSYVLMWMSCFHSLQFKLKMVLFILKDDFEE